MIQITDKTKCCGCWACIQLCQKQCISMQEDNEGFLYPLVDESQCIDCGLCEKVCPVINQNKPIDFEPASYACIANNEILRANSSSGGLFTLLAEEVIKENGVVFGARFEPDWSVVHDYTESIERLDPFRRSKYVQSIIGDCYNKAEFFLKHGRKVLFSGCPCQIAGLNHFLDRKYENLITVDFCCHSVPSPKVWRLYLDELKRSKCASEKKSIQSPNDLPKIVNVTFRDKSEGWRRFGLKINGKYASISDKDTVWLLANHRENSYMKGFLQDLFVRPSCAQCPTRNYSSGSDLMLADFWGVEKYHPEIPILNDNKGVSLALLLTEAGKMYFDKISSKMFTFQIPYNEVEDNGLHSPLTRSTLPHKKRDKLYKKMGNRKLSNLIETCLLGEKIKKVIIVNAKRTLRTLVGNRLYYLLKKL